MTSFDAVVIGGGPAGLTAALYLLRSGIPTALVEKLAPGGQMLLTERIDNYPGFPEGAYGYELADRMVDQLKPYETESFKKYSDEVRALEVGEKRHRVKIGDEWIEAKAVIVATGSRYKRLGIPGEDRLLGRGVSFCALCDGNFFRDQVVAVIGGGNSALEEALYLTKLVKKLYLVHRRDDFRGAKCYQDKCFVHPKIEIVRNSVPSEILGEDGVTGVRLKDVQSGDERVLALDGVFIFIGFEPVHGFLPQAMERDAGGFLVAGPCGETNIRGIFAAGDVRSKVTRQVATAVGDGAATASAVINYLENLHE